jgi:cystathionine beta-lyase/cystathionine gamma-synthase
MCSIERSERFETQVIHAGQQPDPTTGAIVTPIYQTSTYVHERVGVHKGYGYTRTSNPTRAALEKCLATLEAGRHCTAYASGMAATDTVVRMLAPGDHVLMGNDVYGGTYRLFKSEWERFGLSFSVVDMADLAQVEAALAPKTGLIWLETPTNPLLGLADIAAIADLAHRRGILACVDNTFATPYAQRPLTLGADIVLHSTTKYLSGHNDVVGGALVVRDPALHERLAFLQNGVGAVPGPMDCWLTLRGIKTLALRMQAHSANALAVAQHLERHPAVAQVLYPGLPSHPQHKLACRQMSVFGGMLDVDLRGGEVASRHLCEHTRLFALAESLGGVESLIELPAVMTHASVADSPLAIRPSLVRLSVGIEHVDDLIADLDQALAGLL